MNPDASTLAAGAPDRSRPQQGSARPAGLARWRGKPIFVVNRTAPHAASAAGPQDDPAARPIPFAGAPAAALRAELASLGQAGIWRARRHLHASRLHPRIRAAAERDAAGRGLARAAISAPATVRNTISPAASFVAFRRPIICRFRPTASSTMRRYGSAKIPPASNSTSLPSSRSDGPAQREENSSNAASALAAYIRDGPPPI